MVGVLKSVMWRTNKENIPSNDLNIPPCSDIIHNISMRPTEFFKYMKHRTHCLTMMRRYMDLYSNHTYVSNLEVRVIPLVIPIN